jgi:hypothetical protein
LEGILIRKRLVSSNSIIGFGLIILTLILSFLISFEIGISFTSDPLHISVCIFSSIDIFDLLQPIIYNYKSIFIYKQKLIIYSIT